MTKITSFDRNTCAIMRSEMTAALEAIGKKHGIKFEVQGMKFTANNVKVAVEIATIGKGGTVLDRNAVAFNQLATLIGFQKDDLGKTFVFRGTQYKITGYNSKAHKMPIMATSIDGRGYKFPTETVLRAMGRKVPANAFSL